jgi:hypothetical protein
MKKMLFLLVPVALAACGHDERPIVVNPPPAQVVTPAPTVAQPAPVVVVPKP